MKAAHKIIGAYGNRKSEVIDSFDTLREANAMLAEYSLAFGQGWTLWIESTNPNEDGQS